MNPKGNDSLLKFTIYCVAFPNSLFHAAIVVMEVVLYVALLNAESAHSLQPDLCDMGVGDLIIVEGLSLVVKLLSWFVRRCGDIFPSRRGKPFGGLDITQDTSSVRIYLHLIKISH